MRLRNILLKKVTIKHMPAVTALPARSAEDFVLRKMQAAITATIALTASLVCM